MIDIGLVFSLVTQVYKVEGGDYQPKIVAIQLLKEENNKLFAEASIDVAKYVGKRDQKIQCSINKNLSAECLLSVSVDPKKSSIQQTENYATAKVTTNRSHNENAEVSKISRKVGLQSDSQCCESKKMINSLHSENTLLSLKMMELEEKYLAIVDKI